MKVLRLTVALTCALVSRVGAQVGPDSARQAITTVSLLQLIATPERFDGRRVRVMGFLHLELEGNALYVHREDLDANLVANAIGIVPSPAVTAQRKRLDDRYVLVEGTFQASASDTDMGAGALRDVTWIDRWPSHREQARRLRPDAFRKLARP